MKGDSINYAVRNGSGHVDIFLKEFSDYTCFSAVILRCNYWQTSNKLFLGFVDNIESCKRADVDIVFKLKTSYFDKLNEMVKAISPGMIKRIVPTSDDFVSVTPTYVCAEGMDEKQVGALQTILAADGRAPPTLLSGPFGSGKTHILVKAVQHCLNNDQDSGRVRILACTQQHVSANALFENLLEDLPTSLSDSQSVFVRLAADGKKPLQSIRRFWKEVSTCSINLKSEKVLVITTCTTAFNAFKYKRFPQGYFTHVFLDEGAQMREPEAIAPLCLASHNAKLVFAGDKHQVSIVTKLLSWIGKLYGVSATLLSGLTFQFSFIVC